jgi:hypothetical protein
MEIDFQYSGRRTVKKLAAEAAVRFFRKELRLERSHWKMVVMFTRTVADLGHRGCVRVPVPGLIVMELDPGLTQEQMIYTVAHEMVHVKQYATGRLRDETVRGRLVPIWNGRRCTVKDYFDLPWERQAFQNERLLANRFVQFVSGLGI